MAVLDDTDVPKDAIRLSASQLNTAQQCLRKWGFAYLDKVKGPSTAAQTLGKRLHTIAEEWLQTGKPPKPCPISRMFTVGIKHLPRPGKHLLVEHEFLFQDEKSKKLFWKGFIDCVNPEASPPLIIDHKSTKALRWMKTPADLMLDPQAIIYAKYWCEKHDLTEVECQWVYYQTEGKTESKTSGVVLKKSHIDKIYAGFRQRGEELLELKQTKSTGLEIEIENFPHPGCRAYGGCAFQEVCALKHKGEKPMSDLLSRIREMSTKTGSNGTPPPSHPAVEATSTHPAEKPPVPAATVEATAAAINPPKTITAAAFEAKCDEPAAEKPKRKRRTKAEMAAARAEARTEARTEAPVEAPAEAPADGFTLYVDCLPTSGVQSLSPILLQAAAQAATENGEEHYRFIEYGKGAAALCVALTEILAAKPLQGAYAVSSSNQLEADALPVLQSAATGIVKSTR